MSTGGDERDPFAEDWFEEPAGEPAAPFRDPEAETWLEDEPPEDGPVDRRPLIAAIAAVVALILVGVGIARIVGGDDEPAATPPGTTAVTDTIGTGTEGPAATEPPPTGVTTVPEDTTLRNGDEGESVTLLQEALTQLGYDLGAADGVFGPGTQEAVRQFQADSGLDADGIAGPATLAAVNQALAAGG